MAVRRRVATRALVCSALAGLASVPARAQVCTGLPSLRERPLALSGDVAFARGARSVGAGITAGRDAFVGAYVERVTYRDVSYAAMQADTRSTDVGGAAGYEFRIGRLGVCPVASGQWESGPDGTFGSNIFNSDGSTLAAGLSAGMVLPGTGRLRTIPYASATLQRISSTVHDYPFVGTNSRAHDAGWVFSFGVGMALGSRLTLGPSVSIPGGIEGGETTFGLSVSVGLGR